MARRKGRSLSRDEVVDAAVQLVRAEGADALGVSAVARALNIQPPSIYNHVGKGPALARAVRLAAQHLLVDALKDAVRDEFDPGARLRVLARATRDWAHDNEGLYTLMARVEPEPDHPDSAAIDRDLLDLFRQPLGQIGVPSGELVHAIRALRAAVHGFVLLETSGQFQLAEDPNVSFGLLVDMAITGLAREE